MTRLTLPAGVAMRWPTAYEVRLTAGLVLGVYATFHLLNHALGLISVQAQEAARPWVMALWHSPPGQVLLYGSMIAHGLLGLFALVRRRHFRMSAGEAARLLLGLALPYLLLTHIVNTRGTRLTAGIDIDYVYEISMLWVDPVTRGRQIALVLLVWCHFAAGVHLWLRHRPGYRRAFPAALLLYVLVPTLGLLGFAQVGMDMTRQARTDTTWMPKLRAHGTPADPGKAQLRAALKAWAGAGWLGLVGVAAAVGVARNLLARRHTFMVQFPADAPVRAPKGMSVLEVSRMIRRPHMAVCGGRARCTTCRVRIAAAEPGAIPAPGPAEARALERIDAPPGLRLACQLRPKGDVGVQPLLNPTLVTTHAASQRGGRAFDHGLGLGRGPEFGQERAVTVLFLDVRGSTELAEHRLPYDVVFLLNHVFAEMAEAVENSGGHYSNFTGDGLMALFGLGSAPDKGARHAIGCAAGMLERLERLNARLADELDTALAIGVGIHTGVAIIGRMGPPRTPLITALGDTVNAAARLEGLTKELGRPIVASADTLAAAGFIEADLPPLQQVPLRGRAGSLTVAALDAEMVHRLLATSAPKSGRRKTAAQTL